MSSARRKNLLILVIIMAIIAIGYFAIPQPRWSVYAPEDWDRLSSQGVKAMNDRDLDRAEDLFNQAWNSLRNSPANDIHRATILHDLGEVAGFRRDFAKSVQLLQASIKIFDANPGRSEDEKAIALQDLAIAEAGDKKFTDSLNHFEQAIALAENVEGPNGAHLGRYLREYAGILLVLGRLQDSIMSRG